MATYYIYHIPGVKFGCTDNLERRKKEYPEEARNLIELHETHNTPLEASGRERVLNIHFGYYPGAPYTAMIAAAATNRQRAAIRNEKRETERRIMENVNANLPPLFRLRRQYHAVIECPYCGKKNNPGVMKRWHFDACRLKPEGA